jgi:hypothetical protein
LAQVIRKVQKSAKFWDTPELMGKKLTTDEKKRAYESRLEAYRKGSKDPELMRVGGSFMSHGIPKAMRLLPETPSGNLSRPSAASASEVSIKGSASPSPTRLGEGQSKSAASNAGKTSAVEKSKRSSVDKMRRSVERRAKEANNQKSDKRKKPHRRARSTTTATVRVTVRKPVAGKGSDVFDEVDEYHTIVVNNKGNNNSSSSQRRATPKHVRKVQSVEDAKVSMITDAGRTFSVALDDVTAAKLAALDDDDGDECCDSSEEQYGSRSRHRIERRSGGKRSLEHAIAPVVPRGAQPTVSNEATSQSHASHRTAGHGSTKQQRQHKPRSRSKESRQSQHHGHKEHHKHHHHHQHQKSSHKHENRQDTSSHRTERKAHKGRSKNVGSKKEHGSTSSASTAQSKSSRAVVIQTQSQAHRSHTTQRSSAAKSRSRKVTKSTRRRTGDSRYAPNNHSKSIRLDRNTLSRRRLDLTNNGVAKNAEEEGYSKRIGAEIDKMLHVIARIGVHDPQYTGGIKTVSFGDLSREYRKVSDSALVGVLLQAKRKCMVEYQGDILFNGENDDVKITAMTKAKDFVMV